MNSIDIQEGGIKTVTPDGPGVKEHIVIVPENEMGWSTTVCGLDHLEPEFTEYDSVEEVNDDRLCQNCRDRLKQYGSIEQVKQYTRSYNRL